MFVILSGGKCLCGVTDKLIGLIYQILFIASYFLLSLNLLSCMALCYFFPESQNINFNITQKHFIVSASLYICVYLH